MNMNFMERARAERAQPNAAPKAGPHWGKLKAAALLSTPPKVSSRRRWARVGDTVIVVTAKGDPLNQSTRLFVGQTGVLITDDLNEPRIRPYQVRFPNGQNLWFRADEIRLHLEDTPRERASDGLLSRPAASPSEPPPPMRRRLTLMAPLGSHFWDRKRAKVPRPRNVHGLMRDPNRRPRNVHGRMRDPYRPPPSVPPMAIGHEQCCAHLRCLEGSL